MDTINYQYNDYDWRNGVTLYDGTDSITYDYCGNPTSYRGYTMTWAKGKQLSTMTNGEQTLSFKYDANGIRTKKTVNNVEYEYTYVGDKLVRVESNKPYDDPLTIYYTADGNPHSFIYGGGPFYYMLNLQGDVIGIATGNGNVIVEYAYDSWGKPISVTVNNSIYEDIALANPLRYRGYVYDSETELYYLQSRYYDPELCRFISADSYLIAGNYLQGTNMFSYCLNNPVMYSDPSGYATVKDWVKKLICNIGVDFLTDKGWTLAALMFSHAFWGSGENFGSEISTPMIDALRKSATFTNSVKSVIKNSATYKALVSSRLPGAFVINNYEDIEYKLDEPNLHYSIQHASYDIVIVYMVEYCFAIITISDTYDFTEIRTITDDLELNISLSNVANDFGFVLQKLNLIEPYDWSVTLVEMYKV